MGRLHARGEGPPTRAGVAVTDEQLKLVALMEVGAVRLGETLGDRLRIAMDAFHEHWMVVGEPLEFRAACLCVMMSGVSDEDRARVAAEYRVVAAMLRGPRVKIPDGEDAFAAVRAAVPNPVGLLQVWQNTGPESHLRAKAAAAILAGG